MVPMSMTRVTPDRDISIPEEIAYMARLGARVTTRKPIPAWPTHDYSYGLSNPALRPVLVEDDN